MPTRLATAMDKGLYLSRFAGIVRLTRPLNISGATRRHGLGILDEAPEIAERECA